jgi:hypothetical protein
LRGGYVLIDAKCVAICVETKIALEQDSIVGKINILIESRNLNLHPNTQRQRDVGFGILREEPLISSSFDVMFHINLVLVNQ